MGSEILSSKIEGTELVIETSDGPRHYDSKFLVAALLVYVARGSGRIEPEASSRIIQLIRDHFSLPGSESLELITDAMAEIAEQPALGGLLAELAPTLSDGDKEDIALMGLKVVAADGRRDVAEMEQFNRAMEAIAVSPETLHRAFDRYFSETMPGE